MYKHGVISGPDFPVFGLNTGKYEPEITPYFSRSDKITLYHISQKVSYTSAVRGQSYML